MSDRSLALMELSKTLGQGMATQTVRPVGKRSRPRFTREVVAPVVIFSGATFGMFAGGLLALYFLWYPDAPNWPAAIISASACMASAAGGIVALDQLPHYRRLQWTYTSAELPAREPAPDKGRGRWLEKTGKHTRAPSRCEWSPGWKAILAQRTHDSDGAWIGGDRPTRKLFAGLVTRLTDRYDPQGGDVFADLRALGLIDNNDMWTEKARRDLRAELFIPNGGL